MNLSIELQIAMSLVTAVLQGIIKNPTSVASEKNIIHEVALLATQADTAVGGTVWTQGTTPTT